MNSWGHLVLWTSPPPPLLGKELPFPGVAWTDGLLHTSLSQGRGGSWAAPPDTSPGDQKHWPLGRAHHQR